jgi:hypothetical protein
LTQHAERQEERQYRREEKEEERQTRREEQEAERRRRKDLEDRQRQQRQQEEEYKQFTHNLHPFSHYSASSYLQKYPPYSLPRYPTNLDSPFGSLPSQPLSSQLLPHQPLPHQPLPLSQPLSHQPLPSQPLVETYNISRKSSPISNELDDSQVLRRFFEHKTIGQIPEIADKWDRAWRIVNAADWSIADLKEMEDDKSAMYQRAITAGISDGFARRFGRDLRAFKRVHREQEEVANALVGNGKFILRK